jgi:hypothetical protein
MDVIRKPLYSSVIGDPHKIQPITEVDRAAIFACQTQKIFFGKAENRFVCYSLFPTNIFGKQVAQGVHRFYPKQLLEGPV